MGLSMTSRMDMPVGILSMEKTHTVAKTSDYELDLQY